MANLKQRLILYFAALMALVLLALGAPVLAVSGDYGVNTGASAQSSSCGGTSQPPCTLNWHGYGLTFVHVESNGDIEYQFDDFDCTVWEHSDGTFSGRGPECDQYQPPN